MRIAMLGHKRVPSREGGVEVVVEELSVRMAAKGHQVTLYNRSGHHVSGREFDGEKLREYKGITLKTVPAINVKGIAAMTASLFASVRAAFGRYDVVHFHTEGPCATLFLTKLFGKKCVVTVHGLDHQRSKWGKFARTYILLGEKCAAKYADEIIVLSRGVQEYFKKTYNRDTLLIPNGVTLPEKKNAALITEKFGLGKDEYILYLGRITPEKGIHYLIEAYKRLNTGKKLVIAGGASDSDGYFAQLRDMAKDNENILFTGFVQGQLLAELYSNAYVYVLPSDLEGMPLSLMEAMSYGNCCVVSDIAENADVVGEDGIVFQQSNAADLQEKLQMLCNDIKLRDDYQKKIADHIEKALTWDQISKLILDVYGGA